MKHLLALEFLKSRLPTQKQKRVAPSLGFNPESGFSLMEMVIVVLIIAAISAIAAPGWLAFTSRQRIRTVNDAVYRAIQETQSTAKLENLPKVIEFDNTVDPPTYQIYTEDADATEYPVQTLNMNGEIKEGQIDLQVFDGTTLIDTDGEKLLTFDYEGNVSSVADDQTLDDNGFAIVVSSADGGTKHCVIVQTKLGAMTKAEQDDCPG